MASIPLIFRPAARDEYQSIVDQWARSFEPQSGGRDPLVRVSMSPDLRVSPRVWYRGHRMAVRELLEQHGATVATHATEPDGCLAWACWSAPRTLHYVFTIRDARRRGIAQALLQSLGFERSPRTTHHTSAGARLVEKAWPIPWKATAAGI